MLRLHIETGFFPYTFQEHPFRIKVTHFHSGNKTAPAKRNRSPAASTSCIVPQYKFRMRITYYTRGQHSQLLTNYPDLSDTR